MSVFLVVSKKDNKILYTLVENVKEAMSNKYFVEIAETKWAGKNVISCTYYPSGDRFLDMSTTVDVLKVVQSQKVYEEIIKKSELDTFINNALECIE